MKLYVATSNQGKLREFALAGIEAAPVDTSNPPEEDGKTFEENASLKASHYSLLVDGPVIAEDSGLEVDALNGAPGIHSARYAGNDLENNHRLITELKGNAQRGARYICVIAIAEKGQVLATFRGEVEGEIVDEPSGSSGFGYDPHFYYPPFGMTFAETSPEKKFEVSHRRKALDQLFVWLKNRFQTL